MGDYNSALDKKNLRKLGIKSVLTAASGLRISYPTSINHKVYEAIDTDSYDMSKHFEDAFDFIESGLKHIKFFMLIRKNII